ncbi:MAG: hypothetical protein E7187_00395 [Erysipelotrichaceae bacterium]|nr:hypothetical protein [Erysipelotrichaceae bacterium]
MKYILLLILKLVLAGGSLYGLLYLGKREKRQVRLVWLILIPLILFMFPIISSDKETGTRKYWTPVVEMDVRKVDDFRSDTDIWPIPDNYRSVKEGFAPNKKKMAAEQINDVGKLCELSFPAGELVRYSDDRDGFHGDGVIRVTVRYPDNVIAEKLEQSSYWHKLPMDPKLRAYFIEGNSIISEKIPAESGYYFYATRGFGKYDVYQKDEEIIFAEEDYIFAIYDAETYTLYYWNVNI